MNTSPQTSSPPTSKDYPRVLFITDCAFNHLTGGGITFGNLFAGWPSDSLATVTDDPVPVTRDVCRSYYFLSEKEHSYLKPFGFFKGKRQPLSQNASGPAAPSFLRRCAKMILGPASVPDKGHLTPELTAWIAQFKPDVIYTILGSLGYLDLVDQIQRHFRLPLVIHLMDEGVTDPNHRGLFRKYIRAKYRKQFQSLLARAKGRMAICDWMAKEYERRYHFPFDHFQNPVDVARWMPASKKHFEVGKTFRIVFSGSILPFAQSAALKECAAAVKQLASEGVPVALEIYTPLMLLPEKDRQDLLGDGVTLHDALADDQTFFSTLGQSDLLLLPVNFDARSVHYIRLSMPTRIPAYLASGAPILVYGPRGVAQVEYAVENKWGYVVSEQGVEKIKKAILDLMRDQKIREKISVTAKQVAKEKHDAVKVREGFRQALCSATDRLSVFVA